MIPDPLPLVLLRLFPFTRLKTDRMYWRTVLTPTSRRRSPPPLPLPHPPSSTNHVNQRPGPTPYPYALANPALTTQVEFPSANSTPNGTPSGSEVDADHEHDGDHEQDHEQVDENGNPVPTKSGRAGNRRRQKYSRTRTGCLSCRTRRIKCDEARPVCKRCIIAKKTVCPVLNEILRFCERELMDSAFGPVPRRRIVRRRKRGARESGARKRDQNQKTIGK